MQLTINGDKQQFKEDKINVSELLILNKVKMPDMVSVQLNGEFLTKDKFDSTNLKSNDEIDFLYFMGGGAL